LTYVTIILAIVNDTTIYENTKFEERKKISVVMAEKEKKLVL
jgi:hypothetical protein